MAGRFLPVGFILVLTLELAFSRTVIDDIPLSNKQEDKKQVGTDIASHEDAIQSDVNKYAEALEEIEKLALAYFVECEENAKKEIPENELKKKIEEFSHALRKDYQGLAHAKASFIDDLVLLAARRSEKCSDCLLKKICDNVHHIPQELADWLSSDISVDELKRECKKFVVKIAKYLHEPEDQANCSAVKNSRFRTLDGTCNNLKTNTLWGSVDTQFLRLLDPDYADFVSAPRVAKDGKPLPNARTVSLNVHGSNKDGTNPDSKDVSHVTMTWGQFLDHDVTLAEPQGINCEEEPNHNPECVNIKIPEDDEIFRSKEVYFIELERDAPAKERKECTLHPREHSNTLTAFIDGSQVYGVTAEQAEDLRGEGGTLRDMRHPHGCPFQRLLPPLPEEEFCVSKDKNRPCFLAGDERVNENPALMSFHTLFVREHNRIAGVFSKITKWNADRIYDETRKIIGAFMQVITYGEWLPLILGKKTRDDFELNLLKGKAFSNGYNPDVDPSMTAVFAGAVFRFGHSLVQEDFRRFSEEGFQNKDCDEDEEFKPIPVKDFGNPIYLYEKCEGGIDAIWRGLVKNPAAKADGRFSSSVQEHLMRGAGDTSDLCAINIQRGRERGLPSYTAYRNSGICKDIEHVDSFEDLINVAGFPKDVVADLNQTFNDVHDIDIFTGFVFEANDASLGGGLFGPTFQCLVGEQFKRVRFGDRFWHENKPDPSKHTDKSAFTACQLREIRKISLASIICCNSDDINTMRANAFALSSAPIECADVPKVNFEVFKDNYDCENEEDHPSAEY